ncbi:LysR family transcriptional regulator [Verminephrobacter aporrectodeae subsp. tuberculatae]|uniref:LysR family transcriptional regulator n=1 Tax=Verminephrobacter aporrectodeae TaxID=1110389 RepID=UPI002237E6B1|nr:LysR family transcriptional regulator [Verminephrobacter aporrectodeae]MCW5220870.1 LysR family transcriptional regulator [Verminephrobacter aporrectodeae subsp. tuberculatae]MCW5290165.1 LysR family transcriptional regulator [Verminephrobacter aporrectodeae subsp. tuberculatae]
MNIRFLETLVTLAQLKSFRATARALHATPAAISLRIRSLEEGLGTELVDRSGREFRLTPNGEYLLGHAKAVVAAARSMRAAAHKENPVQGRLRLGVIETVVHSWLSRFVGLLSAQYPQVEIELMVDTSSVLQKRLLSDELDLVVRVEGIDRPQIVSTALAICPVQWIAHRDLLPPRPQQLARQVLQHPILSFARATVPQRALEEVVAQLAGREGVPVAQTRITCSPSVAAIVRLVRDGYGIAAIPGLFVSDYLDRGEFVELAPLPPLPAIAVTLCRNAQAQGLTHAAAQVMQRACTEFGQETAPRFIGVLC